MKYGYARVSRADQDEASQVKRLEQAGCEAVLAERASSRKWERPEFQKLLERLEAGDTLVVWRLDRLVGPVDHLERVVKLLEERKVVLVSLNEHIDTSNAVGRMFLQFMGVLNEFRLNYIQEQTLEGLEKARSEGRIGGRRNVLNENLQKQAVKLIEAGDYSQSDVARLMRVSESTISRLWARHQKSRS